MVVPYVNPLSNPIDKYLSDLDHEMSNILKRKDLMVEEKLALYNQILNKFLNKSNDTIKVIQQPTDLVLKEETPVEEKNKKTLNNSIRKIKKPLKIKKEVIYDDQNDRLLTDDFSFEEAKQKDLFGSIKTSPKNSKKDHFSAPIIKRTQSKLSKINNVEEQPNTRNNVKTLQIPLMGDPKWNVNYGQKGTSLKWLSKKYF